MINRCIPVFVDLDGTLIKGDITSILMKKIKSNKGKINFFDLIFNRAKFKHELSIKSDLSQAIDSLNYNNNLIDILLKMRRDEHKIILATGANKLVATKIASHIGLFDAVIASDENFNTISYNKLRKIREFISKNYEIKTPFIYAGDSWIDIPIWLVAQEIIIINPSMMLRNAIKLLNWNKKVTKIKN